jgi:hypothetical protein
MEGGPSMVVLMPRLSKKEPSVSALATRGSKAARTLADDDSSDDSTRTATETEAGRTETETASNWTPAAAAKAAARLFLAWGVMLVTSPGWTKLTVSAY